MNIGILLKLLKQHVPPRPGLVWDYQSHRWIRPEADEETMAKIKNINNRQRDLFRQHAKTGDRKHLEQARELEREAQRLTTTMMRRYPQ